MTPVIGITTYEDQASWRNWSARAAILPYVYVDSVRRSGGRAVMLPPGGEDDEGGKQWAGQLLHVFKHDGYEAAWKQLLEWRVALKRGRPACGTARRGTRGRRFP